VPYFTSQLPGMEKLYCGLITLFELVVLWKLSAVISKNFPAFSAEAVLSDVKITDFHFLDVDWAPMPTIILPVWEDLAFLQLSATSGSQA
jgi:hypothetical protein